MALRVVAVVSDPATMVRRELDTMRSIWSVTDLPDSSAGSSYYMIK